MPSYELMLLVKPLARPEVRSALKRTAESIFGFGGFIRKMDNLGLKKTPYKIRSHGALISDANYFIIQFDVPRGTIQDLDDSLRRDVDVVRRSMFKVLQPTEFPELEPECTLYDDLQQPVFRETVKKILHKTKKFHEKSFKYNTGLDYYPFQR